MQNMIYPNCLYYIKNGKERQWVCGVIRASDGDWVSGFVANLGKGQILETEVWGFFIGLKLAIDKGIRNLVIVMDSATVVHFIQKPSLLAHHPHAALLSSCCEMMNQIGECSIFHVYREKNGVADYLANWSYNFDLGLCVLGVCSYLDCFKTS
ncbi:hypothetical protein CerSpe_220590 [Prunus speciosa]